MGAGAKQKVTLSQMGGTVTEWSVGGVNVFFPQQHLVIQGERKLRGGMHACFPNYGRAQEKFKLPAHGPLRDKQGALENGGSRVAIWGRDLLGNGAYCEVIAEVFTTSGSFVYELTATPGAATKMQLPTNAGFHPYFATPEGKATVHVGKKSCTVTELMTEARIFPMAKEVRIEIPGVGIVLMRPGERFQKTRKARIVLWRDSKEYLCVEPVLGTSADFETGASGWLMSGKPFALSCAFELI